MHRDRRNGDKGKAAPEANESADAHAVARRARLFSTRPSSSRAWLAGTAPGGARATSCASSLAGRTFIDSRQLVELTTRVAVELLFST